MSCTLGLSSAAFHHTIKAIAITIAATAVTGIQGNGLPGPFVGVGVNPRLGRFAVETGSSCPGGSGLRWGVGAGFEETGCLVCCGNAISTGVSGGSIIVLESGFGITGCCLVATYFRLLLSNSSSAVSTSHPV